MKPEVSVIIPTYRDWQRLALTLDALRRQTLAAERFEVIVADNDDNPAPESQRPAGVRYVHEPAGWSYAARNAGLALAQGEIFAFTDADCIPEPDWLEQGLKAMHADPALDLAGGNIEIFREDNDSVAARYDCAYGLRQAEYFQRYGGFATANVFARRRLIEAIGPFNASFESGGDFDLSRRAGAAGRKLAYLPQARIRHPARDTLGELTRQTRRIARGVIDFAYRPTIPSPARAWRVGLRTLAPRVIDWYYCLRGGRGSEVLKPSQRPAVLLYRIYLHYVFSFSLIAALARSMRERGWPEPKT